MIRPRARNFALTAFCLVLLTTTAAQARTEIVWGDLNGFTLDGSPVSAAVGPPGMLAQLILATTGAPAPIDVNAPDGLGAGDVLLASAIVSPDVSNPLGRFLQNFGSPLAPPAPGELVYLRIFSADAVAVGLRYAESVPFVVSDIVYQPPQPVSFTGDPASFMYGLPPRELNLIVDDPTAAPPDLYLLRLGEPRPNPFNPRVTLTLFVPEGGANVEIAIFDVSGRRVATLGRGAYEGGEHPLVWEGADETGRPVASGVYRARSVRGPSVESQSFVLVR